MVILQYRDMVDANLIGAASDAGNAHRAAVADFLTTNDGENTSLGIELDVRYDNSPIVYGAGDDAPRWNRCVFTPTVRTGHRAPNVVIAEDETLFDRFGPVFTLVDAVGGPSDAKRLLNEADLADLPVRHVVLDDSRLRQLYRRRLVLVRPDLHIAWSGDTLGDPAGVITRVRGA
jgi:hypothetical protein